MQCYLLLYTEDGERVLIAKKKLQGSRFNGQATKPQILNYAAQWVIPGGAAKPNELEKDAAAREFFEETGVKIFAEGQKHPDIGDIDTKNFTDGNGGNFSCTFAVANNTTFFKKLIESNLADVNNPPADDELEVVEWVDVVEAKQRFTNRNKVSATYQREAYKPRDWFVIALNFLVTELHHYRYKTTRKQIMNNEEANQLRKILLQIGQLANSAANIGQSSQQDTDKQKSDVPQLFRTGKQQINPNNYKASFAPIAFPDLLALSDISTPDAASSKYDDDTKEIQTCFVIGLSPDESLGMKETYQDILDVISMITGIANQRLFEKIKDGSIEKDDYLKQGDYRARLMQALILNTKGFLAADQMIALNKTVDTLAAQLHTSIIKALFAGIAMPAAVIPMLEKSFDDLKSSVLTMSKKSNVDGKHIFLILRYFEKNALGIAEAKIRLFLFKMTSDIVKITVGKSDVQHVHLEMDFASDQYIFNEKIYAQVRKSFNDDLVEAGKNTLKNYSNVDVQV